MTSFETICRATPRSPFLLLLYIGTDASRAAQLRESVGVGVELRQFFQAASWEDAASLLTKQDLRVAWWDGCLFVICDLEDPPPGEVLAWLRRLPKWPSGQVAAFLVTEASLRLTLYDFFALVDRDFAGTGDFAVCLECVRGWCSLGGAPDFGLPFPKRPSRWLLDLKHDYIANIVLVYREIFENLDLLTAQREIDFIANVLRNLLGLPDSRLAVRGFPAERAEEESALHRRIYSTPVRIVAPLDLEKLLALEYTKDTDFVLYQTAEIAAELLEKLAQEGCARILFRAPETRLPEIRQVAAGPGELPTVLIGETAPRMEWYEWQTRLANNVIGSYAVSDLEGRRSGKPLLVAQRPYWRACASLSLHGLFDRLIELLVQTYLAVDQGAPTLREHVFRSLAAVGSARAIYLGQTKTGTGS